MKTSRFLFAALCGGTLILSAHAEKVRFEQLPIELRDKILIHSGSNPIEDIDRQTKSGQTTYQVGFKKDGQHTELTFDQQGNLVSDPTGSALSSGKISYNQLPEAVRKMVETRVKSGEINDVERKVKNGEATYEIGFKQADQRQQEIVLSHDGRILSDSPAVAAGAPARGTSASSGPNALLAEPVTLSSSSKVQLSQLPAPIQRAISTAAAGARIEDVERGTWQGQTVYQAGFKDSGRHVEVQVRENGTILHDPRAVGSAASSSSGRAVSTSRSPEYASVTSLVPLSASSKVERSSLPAAVQRRLTTHITTDKIEDIERGSWQGKTIYQVAFKDPAGKHVELQIDERGNIVYDPRGK
jgi:uncharacterized membrane protein YkoI